MANEKFQDYISCLISLHDLILQGGGEGEEAEVLRLKMDDLWLLLTSHEISLVREISADLNGPIPGRKDAQAVPLAFTEFAFARKSFDSEWHWKKFLEYLRKGEELILKDLLFFCKAEAWHHRKQHAMALAMYKRSIALNPAEPNYSFMYLARLYEVDKTAALRMCRDIADTAESASILFIKAGEIILKEAESSIVLNQDDYKLAITCFEKALRNRSSLTDIQLTGALMLLGIAHKSLGKSDEAYKCYSEVLSLKPTHSLARVARGVLIYGSDPEKAVADFQVVVENPHSSVWPFFYLAHYALTQAQYNDVLKYGETAIGLTSDPQILAEILVWMAIANLKLSPQKKHAFSLLNKAKTLAPENPRVVHNSQLFESSLNFSNTKWEVQSASDLDAIASPRIHTDSELVFRN